MIDSHAHIISEFYNNIDETVKTIKDKGIVDVINCGDGINTSKEVIEINKKYDILKPAVGMHPENISDSNKIDELEELIKNNKIYAVGEIGLDYYWNKENKDDQKDLFSERSTSNFPCYQSIDQYAFIFSGSDCSPAYFR